MFLLLILDIVALLVGAVIVLVMGKAAFSEKKLGLAIGQWLITLWAIGAEVLFFKYGQSIMAMFK